MPLPPSAFPSLLETFLSGMETSSMIWQIPMVTLLETFLSGMETRWYYGCTARKRSSLETFLSGMETGIATTKPIRTRPDLETFLSGMETYFHRLSSVGLHDP